MNLVSTWLLVSMSYGAHVIHPHTSQQDCEVSRVNIIAKNIEDVKAEDKLHYWAHIYALRFKCVEMVNSAGGKKPFTLGG